jgi:hypothetical protein
LKLPDIFRNARRKKYKKIPTVTNSFATVTICIGNNQVCTKKNLKRIVTVKTCPANREIEEFVYLIDFPGAETWGARRNSPVPLVPAPLDLLAW